MELVKFIQAYFIDNDIEMYYEKTDIPAKARTSNLNEELGQIDVILTDKTGTLTRNEMKFARCTIGQKEYGTTAQMQASNESRERPERCDGIPDFNSKEKKAAAGADEESLFNDHRIFYDAQSQYNSNEEHRSQVNEFCTLLSICHNVLPNFSNENKDGTKGAGVGCKKDHIHAQELSCAGAIQYLAQSPDELALVEAALEFQYFFHSIVPARFDFHSRFIQGNRITVNIHGEHQHFDIFEVLEFDSTRKRMSIIAYDHRDKLIKLYTKGADNIIRERLCQETVEQHWPVTLKSLNSFASIGLRTLCCAYRVLSVEEFISWYDSHQVAKSSMGSERANRIAESAERIEIQLTLLGSTAIEDRLQDQVPETIAALSSAGIKICMLTGDKVETAINIGRSANLLTDAMVQENLLIIDIDETLNDKQAKIETIEALTAAEEGLFNRVGANPDHIGIVVSGKALSYVFPRKPIVTKPAAAAAMNKSKKSISASAAKTSAVVSLREEEDRKLQLRFLKVLITCRAVICCRCSPLQKSQIVRLIRDYTRMITLAIGDGANDVAMIEAAAVGIGIEGLEGKQAVMASDVSIGQFRFLQRLLLVHGAWSYRRLSTLILYSFYKNIAAALLQILFAFQSAFSGQLFLDAYSSSLYNLAFTSLPIMLAAVFNRDLDAETLMRHPRLYRGGQRNEHFNLKLLGSYIAKGIVDSLLLFFITINVLGSTTYNYSNGQVNDLWAISLAVFSCLVFTVTLKVSIDSTTTWIRSYSLLILGLSVLSWFVWGIFFTSVQLFDIDTLGAFIQLLSQPTYYLLLIFLPVACMVPDFAWKNYIRPQFFPNTIDIGRYYLHKLMEVEEREKMEIEKEAKEAQERVRRRTAGEMAVDGGEDGAPNYKVTAFGAVPTTDPAFPPLSFHQQGIELSSRTPSPRVPIDNDLPDSTGSVSASTGTRLSRSPVPPEIIDAASHFGVREQGNDDEDENSKKKKGNKKKDRDSMKEKILTINSSSDDEEDESTRRPLPRVSSSVTPSARLPPTSSIHSLPRSSSAFPPSSPSGNYHTHSSHPHPHLATLQHHSSWREISESLRAARGFSPFAADERRKKMITVPTTGGRNGSGGRKASAESQISQSRGISMRGVDSDSDEDNGNGNHERKSQTSRRDATGGADGLDGFDMDAAHMHVSARDLLDLNLAKMKRRTISIESTVASRAARAAEKYEASEKKAAK